MPLANTPFRCAPATAAIAKAVSGLLPALLKAQCVGEMLKNVRISGYRRFSELTLTGLNRVNLFVGQNNNGKTSILEAAQILASEGHLGVLFRSLRRRGEIISVNELERIVEEYDISHLFHGHRFKLGSAFGLEGFNGKPISVVCEIVPAPQDKGTAQLPIFDVDEGHQVALSVKVAGSSVTTIPLSPFGGVPLDTFRRRPLGSPGTGMLMGDAAEAPPIRVVPTEGLETRNLGLLWDGIALTPDEPKVIEALQIIEPIENRII